VLKEINDNSPGNIIRHNRLQNNLPDNKDVVVLRVNFQGLIPAGEAVLENKGEELYAGKKVYHLSAKAVVLPFYSKIYNVRAEADSYIDPYKLYTLKFTQTLILPNKPRDEKVILYDQEKNFMELKGVKRQILPGTQDPLSAIFFLRHQKLGLGKEFDLNINTNQKNYQLYAKVTEKEVYTLGSKEVNVWVMDAIIRRRDKNPYHKTTMRLWLLDNPAKTPLLIKVMSNVGLVTARLVSTE